MSASSRGASALVVLAAASLTAVLFLTAVLAVSSILSRPLAAQLQEPTAETDRSETSDSETSDSETGEPLFSTLAGYTFDQGLTPTGPATFRVWEEARGRVTRSTHFRYSGEYAVELSDVAGNGDFPELAGFFDRRETGHFYIHFALLTVDPTQEIHVALVGPRRFRPVKDGFALHLHTGPDGRLFHVTARQARPLLPLEPFTWYRVDALLDLDAGTYDLWIQREGDSEPRVVLTDQPNAVGEPGSAVEVFSFVTDPFKDRSEAVYYVDDLVLGAEGDLTPERFAAPGRRKLFVEHGIEAEIAGRRRQIERLRREIEERRRVGGAGPTAGEEAALEPDEFLLLVEAGALEDAYRWARNRLAEGGPRAWWQRRAGDAALLRGEAALALEHYRAAVAAGGDAPHLMLRRADALHLLGDVAGEKRLREAIYGTLGATSEPR